MACDSRCATMNVEERMVWTVVSGVYEVWKADFEIRWIRTPLMMNTTKNNTECE
jgi:hypothetical protein